MKWRVDGQEAILHPNTEGVSVKKAVDRLYVRTPDGTGTALAVQAGGVTWVSYGGRVFEIEPFLARTGRAAPLSSGEFRAPMPGAVIDVLVAEGDTVVKGQKLLVLEAMKTQQPIASPFDGRVAALGVEKGRQVAEGDLLVRVEPTGE